MNEVLVIVRSGFMGSYVVNLLNDNGYVVTFLDKETSLWLADDQAI